MTWKNKAQNRINMVNLSINCDNKCHKLYSNCKLLHGNLVKFLSNILFLRMCVQSNKSILNVNKTKKQNRDLLWVDMVVVLVTAILPMFLLFGIMATVSALYPHLPMSLNFTEICSLKYRLKHWREQNYHIDL